MQAQKDVAEEEEQEKTHICMSLRAAQDDLNNAREAVEALFSSTLKPVFARTQGEHKLREQLMGEFPFLQVVALIAPHCQSAAFRKKHRMTEDDDEFTYASRMQNVMYPGDNVLDPADKRLKILEEFEILTEDTLTAEGKLTEGTLTKYLKLGMMEEHDIIVEANGVKKLRAKYFDSPEERKRKEEKRRELEKTEMWQRVSMHRRRVAHWLFAAPRCARSQNLCASDVARAGADSMGTLLYERERRAGAPGTGHRPLVCARDENVWSQDG